MRGGFWLSGLVAMSFGLASCSSLPSQGPLSREIVESSQDAQGAPRFLLIDINDRVAALLSELPRASLFGSFGDRRGSPTPVIGVGDTLTVTVWEAAAGGLFSTPVTTAASTGSHSVVIPEQVVSRDGSITVPYAGRIQVAGLTPPAVEQAVIRNLAGKAIEPQALVSVTRPTSNSITVTGEVVNGARVPLNTRGDRILDIIASAGGVRAPVHETFIALTRGRSTVTVPMQTLLARPAENIFLRPGDIITLVRDPQTFTVFGATGRNAVVPFDALGLSLAEAVAKAGGLIDFQSDARGVFLMRPESASFVRRLSPEYPILPGESTVNVVYRADMKDANTFFVARRIAVRNKDIVYVASSPISEIQKIVSFVQSATQTPTQILSICSAAGAHC